ncbi:MAG: pre-peptidase C-terminal domain-containing protein [Gemmatimonadaceae bacterium]
MTHRSVFRITATLLAALSLGCTTDEPTSVAPETRLNIMPLFAGIDPGATQQVTATIGSDPVQASWQSSNPAVATVSATGLVTALTPGFAAITATLASDPSRLITSNITVLPLLGTGITNGVAFGPLASSAARGSTVIYRIFVPAGKTNLNVTLSGGTGDADIYIRRATPPTLSAFTCASENGGNGESCDIANPQSGTWYIVIGLYDPYANAFLKATYTP